MTEQPKQWAVSPLTLNRSAVNDVRRDLGYIYLEMLDLRDADHEISTTSLNTLVLRLSACIDGLSALEPIEKPSRTFTQKRFRLAYEAQLAEEAKDEVTMMASDLKMIKESISDARDTMNRRKEGSPETKQKALKTAMQSLNRYVIDALDKQLETGRSR